MTLEEVTQQRLQRLGDKCAVCRSPDRARVDKELAKVPRDVTYQDVCVWLKSKGVKLTARVVENHWIRRHRERFTERTRSSE